jgi:hypothetical protein
VKKNDKKILVFPQPKVAASTTITCRIGSQRFVMHLHIEDLPPAKPVIPFKSPPRRKGKSMK